MKDTIFSLVIIFSLFVGINTLKFQPLSIKMLQLDLPSWSTLTIHIRFIIIIRCSEPRHVSGFLLLRLHSMVRAAPVLHLSSSHLADDQTGTSDNGKHSLCLLWTSLPSCMPWHLPGLRQAYHRTSSLFSLLQTVGYSSHSGYSKNYSGHHPNRWKDNPFCYGYTVIRKFTCFLFIPFPSK